ncbi:MAG: M23 family metallopeptidase [Alphaproteobacteria bacterium]|nr:M23 family metallopeptidase [Alphaproteobacteria bacterium]
MMRHFPFLILLFAAPAGAAEADIRLDAPVDCTGTRLCYVQNFVDRDPGPGFLDHRCGLLGYDGHTGTDIAVANGKEMRRGVPVLAAAAGRVRAVRDGMADVHMREADPASLKDRALGNAVILDHGNGWQTRYGHLRRGTVRVRPGEQVAAGSVLGEIGLSGRTEFPHLHFEVRLDEQVIDPYLGADAPAGCGAPGRPLWSARAGALLTYRPAGIVDAGFAGEAPVKEKAEAGLYDGVVLDGNARVLTFWYRAWGIGPEDRRRMRLIGPSGEILAESAGQRVDRHKAQWFEYAGISRRSGTLAPGIYRGEIRIERRAADGSPEVIELSRSIERR